MRAGRFARLRLTYRRHIRQALDQGGEDAADAMRDDYNAEPPELDEPQLDPAAERRRR